MSALCTICQENFGEGEQIPFALECGHMFHSSCISQWFLGGGRVGPDLGKCPTCNHINSMCKFLRLFPTAGEDDNDRGDNLELERSLMEMKREVTDLKSKLVVREDNRELERSLQKMKREVTQLKSKLDETTRNLDYLYLRYQEESGAHASLKMEHKCFVDNIGRELEKVKEDQEGNPDVDKTLMKIANVFHFCSRDTSQLNVVDEDRDAVLAYAVWRKRPVSNISSLIWRGADWRHLNKNEQSLLHIAASDGTALVLKFFLELGELDVNAVDRDGATPLHLSLMFEKDGRFLVEKCKLLIKNGADVGIRMSDKKGKTPLALALEHTNKEIKVELKRILLAEFLESEQKDDGEGEREDRAVPEEASNSSPNPIRGNMNGRGRGRGRSRRGRNQRQNKLNSNGMV